MADYSSIFPQTAAMSPYQIYQATQKGFADAQAAAQQRKLADLASQAYNAPQGQQRGLIGQAIGIDPSSGFGLNDKLTADRADSMKQLGQVATLMVNAPDDPSREAIHQQYLPLFQRILGPSAPPNYDPSQLPGLQKLAQSFGNQNPALAPHVMGNELVDATGKVLHTSPAAAPKPIWDSARGAWIYPPSDAAPQAVPSSPVAPPQAGASPVGFDANVAALFPREGGYKAHDGNGQPVNFGINQGANPDVNVANLTQDQAKQIYKQRYWDAINGDSLPPQIQAQAFDAAVNMGPHRALELLQASGGDPAKFAALRGKSYQDIAAANPNLAPNLPGWLNRNDQVAGAPAQGGARIVQVAPPKVKEKPAPSGYEWTDDKQNRLQRIPGGPADVGDTGIDPAEADFYATQEISGDKSWRSNFRGKQGQAVLAAVTARVPQMAAELGLSPQDIGTNKASYAALSKTLADRTKYVTAVNQYGSQLEDQAALVESLMQKGAANGTSPILNRWIQAGRKGIEGDPDVTAFDNAITGLAREHQRLLTGPMSSAQLTVSAANTGDRLVNDSQNIPQVEAAIKEMRSEVGIARKNGAQAVTDTQDKLRALGKAAPGSGTPQAGSLPHVSTKAQFDALPKGALYIEPDGKTYRKP